MGCETRTQTLSPERCCDPSREQAEALGENRRIFVLAAAAAALYGLVNLSTQKWILHCDKGWRKVLLEGTAQA